MFAKSQLVLSETVKNLILLMSDRSCNWQFSKLLENGITFCHVGAKLVVMVTFVLK